jgi:hypothetical protein
MPWRRKPLVTLLDAAIYITSLPKMERHAEHWRPAAVLLKLVGENGGCVVLAQLAFNTGYAKGANQ